MCYLQAYFGGTSDNPCFAGEVKFKLRKRFWEKVCFIFAWKNFKFSVETPTSFRALAKLVMV